MAINVNTVYTTVLSILNKEQRGYITPEEFNKLATQVQLDIFENYFEDLNQQLRVPQADSEYANRQKNIDNCISIFKTIGNTTYNAAGGYFLPPSDLHRIGTVIYKDEKELQRVERNDFLNINLSPLTKPTTQFPVYLYEQVVQGTGGANTGETHIFVKPTTIVTAADITVSYIRKPADVLWGYQQLGGGTWSSGPYIYNAGASTQFELDDTEQTEVILRILAYAGVVIRDPQIVQAASQAVQSEEINSKS
jgi:hypothetical protein